MLSAPKKQSRRLSSLFSLGSAESKELKEQKEARETGSVASSESSSRLSKVKKRINSAGSGPSAPAQKNISVSAPVAIQQVDSLADAFAPLQPPPPLTTSHRNSSTSSLGVLSKSRPVTPGTPNGGGLLSPADGEVKKNRRRTRLFGYGDSSDEKVHNQHAGGPSAWVVGHQGKVEYDLTTLLNGERVPELWDETGDTFIYLFPRTSEKGPSFRIDSTVYASSQYMTRLLHGRLYSDSTELPDHSVRSSSATFAAPSRTGSPDASVIDSSDGSKGSRALSDATEDDHSEKHLYMPIALTTDLAPVTPGNLAEQLSTKDVDTLVSYRNFFAFLIGQSLVATQRHSEIFDIFLRIADILQHYKFSNVDGSTFGEVAASSFDSYVDELCLADVRQSREKTIEAIVLGEKMRSMSLYIEGFVHAVGKYDSIKDLDHPKFSLISPKTGTRLARAALDLGNREMHINHKLKEFEFPAMFSGIMNSAMAAEKNTVRFGKWKSSFMSTRSFVLSYYKSKYGSWLPRARNKKNNLTTSGLNRLVLLDVYQDLSDLYDLLVDRSNLTNRTADGFMSEDERTDFESVAALALRKVLSEYDRSTPPVQPPIPFDLPLYPTLRDLNKDYPTGDVKKDAKARTKGLSKDQIAKVIKASHNEDADKKTAFLDAFRQFEHKQASGSTMEELYELRAGQWLFMYAVIQSLPMLVIDAPGVRFTEGVEYFLCEVPRAGVPWGREDSRARTWFGVNGGSQVVSLPTDVVENGVEGVFRRSHCWKMAEKWAQNDTLLNAAMNEMNAAPLPPPPGFLDPSSAVPRPRSDSPSIIGDRRRESVLNLGLDALPLPPGFAPGGASPGSGSPSLRPQSVHDPTKTFDSILSSVPNQKDKKKKK